MALRTAMGTVAAAGGFPLPLLADQGKGNEGDNGDEYNRNQNRREVRANPAEHGKSLLCVCEFWKGSGLERGGFLVVSPESTATASFSSAGCTAISSS